MDVASFAPHQDGSSAPAVTRTIPEGPSPRLLGCLVSQSFALMRCWPRPPSLVNLHLYIGLFVFVSNFVLRTQLYRIFCRDRRGLPDLMIPDDPSFVEGARRPPKRLLLRRGWEKVLARQACARKGHIGVSAAASGWVRWSMD
jgi:hypothetical protein